jgi:hypothetical protein
MLAAESPAYLIPVPVRHRAFRPFEAWKEKQPERRDGFKPNVDGFEVFPMPMKAG